MNRVPHYLDLQEYTDLQETIEIANMFTNVIAGFCHHNQQLTELERATIQIASGTFSILFSINELLGAGYLVSAKILLQPIIDRMSTIAWLRANGDEGLAVWNRGWTNKERPKFLSQKLSCFHQSDIFEEKSDQTLKEILEDDYVEILHGEVHGDLQSALRNSAVGGDLDGYVAAGPNPFNAPEFVSICKLTSLLTMQFLKEIQIAMPRLGRKDVI